MRLMRSALVASCAVVALAAVDPFTPARYNGGPILPVTVEPIGGGPMLLERTKYPSQAAVIVAPFPATALGDDEVRVEPGGNATNARVARSAPPFDDAALTAARQWMFRPARLHGPVATLACILFGFRRPITG